MHKNANKCNIFKFSLYTGIVSKVSVRRESFMRRRRFNCNKGVMGLAFAFGLLISCFCPPKFLVAVLAIWVIILGFSCRRC